MNNNYVEQLEAQGMVVAGRSEDGELVEMIELEEHPWFLACQFHPEFTSSPLRGHPLFSEFVNAGVEHGGQMDISETGVSGLASVQAGSP